MRLLGFCGCAFFFAAYYTFNTGYALAYTVSLGVLFIFLALREMARTKAQNQKEKENE